jgi:hypothetical protein
MTAPTWTTALMHGAVATHSVPAPPAARGDAPRLPLHEQARYRAAAHHARRVFPGPVGELVSTELLACAEFGHELADDGLGSRLAAQVLALPADTN